MFPIDSLKRDAEIIQALHIARYTLTIHNGALCTCEGESFQMNFTKELEHIDQVMTMLGVDLTEVLPAPVNWKEDDDAGTLPPV